MGRIETIKERYGEDYFSKQGGKGGKAKVKKGVATLSKKERSKRGKEAAAARWANKEKP